MKSFVLFTFLVLAGFSFAEEEPEYDGKYIEEYPSLVQIEFGYGRVWLQGCTGSVLTARHVLSAARCFSGRLYSLSQRRIRAGATLRSVAGDIFPVQSATNHPSFVNAADGDISVVSLGAAFIFGTTIAQGSIVAQGSVIPTSLAVESAGWGVTSQDRIIPNRGLYSINLVTISYEACVDLYGSFPILSFTVTENMLCSGVDATTGRLLDPVDVGSPLYYDGIIIGLLSWSRTFGNISYPLVATNVASYTDWIVAAVV